MEEARGPGRQVGPAVGLGRLDRDQTHLWFCVSTRLSQAGPSRVLCPAACPAARLWVVGQLLGRGPFSLFFVLCKNLRPSVRTETCT